MKKERKHYYVVVDGKVVYKRDNVSRMAYWANPHAMPDGEKPLDMSKSEAEDLCECLILNFHNAHVEMYYWEMPFETRVPKLECYCTNKVPVTDCEGCEHVMACTNCYDPSDKSANKQGAKAVPMTDEQIATGLSCCSSMDRVGCPKCPYKAHKDCLLCMQMLMSDALAYFKRSQAANKPSEGKND